MSRCSSPNPSLVPTHALRRGLQRNDVRFEAPLRRAVPLHATQQPPVPHLFGPRCLCTIRQSPWALRMPAFFAGLLLVPTTYVAARSLYRTESAILAAALTASSSVLIEYSTNSRGYSLVCLFFTVLIPIAAYLIRNPGWTGWFLFSIFAALGFYTIPIMLYPVGGVAAWVLLSAAAGDAKPPRRIVSGLFVAGFLTAVLTTVLYSPVFAVSGPASVFREQCRAGAAHQGLSERASCLVCVDLEVLEPWITAAPDHCPGGWFRNLPDLPYALQPVPHPFAVGAHRLSRAHTLCPTRCAIRRVWTFALPLYFAASAAGFALVATWLLSRLPIRHGMTLFVVAMCLWTAWYVRRGDIIYSTNEGRGMQDTAMYLKPRLTTGDSVLVTLPSLAPLEYYFLKQEIPIAYLNAPVSHHLFIVVNQVAADTLAKVLASREIDPPRQPGVPIAQFDSVVLYEIPATE